MIVVNLDVMMAKRKMTLSQLAAKVDITMANLSILKNNKARAVRFSTLSAICAALHCQPGDLLEYMPDEEGEALLGKGQTSLPDPETLEAGEWDTAQPPVQDVLHRQPYYSADAHKSQKIH